MYLIVGLGNPGEKYENTRHNLGFLAVDELRRKLKMGEWSLEKKLKAEIVKFDEFILARPQTYMNVSGMSVDAITKYYKISPDEVIVVHDELDLPLGHIKIRRGGSDAGHHGIESIIKSLGTDQFVRVRLGIGVLKAVSGEHKHVSFNAEKFVIDPFSRGEGSKVKSMLKRSVKAVEAIINEGLEKAQNQFNDRGL